MPAKYNRKNKKKSKLLSQKNRTHQRKPQESANVSAPVAKKIDTTDEMIKLCKKLLTTCNTSPYSTMEPRERYQELYEINKAFAQSHPVVYKLIVEEKKFSTAAFKKYLFKYNKTMITPDKQPELGSYYIMYLEMQRNKNQHHNMKEYYKYKIDCQKQMEDDMERVKTIQKEEGDKYDKREEERIEENRQELLDFFTKLNQLKAKVDEFKQANGMDSDIIGSDIIGSDITNESESIARTSISTSDDTDITSSNPDNIIDEDEL